MQLVEKYPWGKCGYDATGNIRIMWLKTAEEWEACKEIVDPEEEEQYVIHAFIELGKET